MNGFRDKTSRFINHAVELLLIKYPTRTSLGIMLGLVLDLLFNAFDPLISRAEWLAPEKISRWQFMPLGIIIAHLRTIIGLFFVRSDFPEAIENTIRLIEDSNLSSTEKRQQYRLLIQSVIENVTLNKATKTEIREVQEELQSQR